MQESNPDNIAEAGRLRLPYGTCGSLRQSTAAAHSEAGRRRLCRITPWRGGGKPMLAGFWLAAVGPEQAAPAVPD